MFLLITTSINSSGHRLCLLLASSCTKHEKSVISVHPHHGPRRRDGYGSHLSAGETAAGVKKFALSSRWSVGCTLPAPACFPWCEAAFLQSWKYSTLVHVEITLLRKTRIFFRIAPESARSLPAHSGAEASHCCPHISLPLPLFPAVPPGSSHE